MKMIQKNINRITHVGFTHFTTTDISGNYSEIFLYLHGASCGTRLKGKNLVEFNRCGIMNRRVSIDRLIGAYVRLISLAIGVNVGELWRRGPPRAVRNIGNRRIIDIRFDSRLPHRTE